METKKLTIKSLKWGQVTLSDESIYKDVIVDQSESTLWDWSTTNLHHNPGYSKKQSKKLLEYYNVPENSQVIFSTGMNCKINSGITGGNVIFLPSQEAVKLYNKEVELNNAVILFLHSTC